MSEVLLISKPVAPPWNDSSKNLVRDLACAMRRHDPVVMGRRGTTLPLARGRIEPVYPSVSSGGFAPALRDNLRVLGRLVGGEPADLWHFFFAPNFRTSQVGRLASRARRVRTVHTVCSAPREDADLQRVLFADVTVVLSEHTERRLCAAGVPAERIRRIPPGIEPLEPLSPSASAEARRTLGLPQTAPLVLFPGDLEFGEGASLSLEAFARLPSEDAWLVMACRAKTAAARERERELRARAGELGLDARVRWVGETPRIHDLVGVADVVLLPSDTLYAKMDYPLVVLEAMSLARAVIVADGTAAAELAAGDAVRVVEPEVAPLAAAVEALLGDLEERTGLGSRARRAALERYTREPMAQAYEALYDAIA